MYDSPVRSHGRRALATTAIDMIDSASGQRNGSCRRVAASTSVDPPYRELTAGTFTARQLHLDQVHWVQGSTGTTCVTPGGRLTFYRDGQHRSSTPTT